LLDIFTSPGMTDEVIRIYLARGISESTDRFRPEDEEITITVVRLPLDDAVAGDRRALARRAGPRRVVTATRSIAALGSRSLAPARVVASYLDHLAVERGVAANTLLSYRRDLGRYQEYL